MRIYKGVNKRQAKKHIGPAFNKLSLAGKLAPGDLIHTCRGWNERIVEITPDWLYWGDKRIVYDFDVILEGGGSCSVRNCCTLPLPSRTEIVQYFLNWNTPEGIQSLKDMYMRTTLLIIEALLAGDRVFDENGILVGPED